MTMAAFMVMGVVMGVKRLAGMLVTGCFRTRVAHRVQSAWKIRLPHIGNSVLTAPANRLRRPPAGRGVIEG
jgi:hypothetical protein